eukprot:3329175-Karenia_brevis.AAC.1
MGSIPKVAFVEFSSVDTMWNFNNSFKEVARSNTKLWCAPKRKLDEPDDKSQIVLNKIKRAICESTTCPGKSIKIDRKSSPRVVYKLHNGGLIEVAKVDESTNAITWDTAVEQHIRQKASELLVASKVGATAE